MRKKKDDHLHGASGAGAFPPLGLYTRESIEVCGLLVDVLVRLERLPTENQLAVLDQLLSDMRSWHTPATGVVKALRQWIRDDNDDMPPPPSKRRKETPEDALPWDRARDELADAAGVRDHDGEQQDQ